MKKTGPEGWGSVNKADKTTKLQAANLMKQTSKYRDNVRWERQASRQGN